MISGIYQIRCLVNGRVYIGSAVAIERRWRDHRSQLDRGIHHSRYLQRAWLKYGPDQFAFEVLEIVDNPADLVQIEQTYINNAKSYLQGWGFNMSPTAGSQFGVKRSPETRARISAATSRSRVGMKHSEETRAKMSAAGMGRKLSEEAKAKISAARTGKKLSEEHRAKIGATQKGRTLSPEVRTKMSTARRRRPPPSPETRAKISEAMKGHQISAETRAKISAIHKARAKAARLG